MIFFALLGLSFSKPRQSLASEGTFVVRSTNGEAYHCWAASLFMPYNKYRLIVGCADLVYPPIPRENYKFYMLWANPTDKSKPMRLGQLAGGTAEYAVPKPFNELFVSLEYAENVRAPSELIVMRGAVQPIESLLRPQSPTPTQEAVDQPTDTNQETTIDTSQLSTKDKLVLALKRAGVAAVVALVVIIGLVFVVSRSRG